MDSEAAAETAIAQLLSAREEDLEKARKGSRRATDFSNGGSIWRPFAVWYTSATFDNFLQLSSTFSNIS